MVKNALTGYALAIIVTGITNIILPAWSYDLVLLTDSQSKTIYLSSGQNFSITCYPDSEGEDEIKSLQWSEYNRTVVSEGNKLVTIKRGNQLTLTISNLTPDDSGIYQCNALYKTNQALKTEVYLTVADATEPTFEDSYENITVTEFSRLELLCNANGTPPMKYEWYDQNGDNIPGWTYASLRHISESSNGSLLTINNITIVQSGSYMCSARNKYGIKSKVYELEVIEGDGTIEDMLHLEDINVTEVTANSVTFGIPSQKKFDYIDVSYRHSENNGVRPRKIRWQQGDSLTVKGLSPSSEIEFVFEHLLIPNMTRVRRSINVPLFPSVPEVALMQADKGNLRIRIIIRSTWRKRNRIDSFQVSYELSNNMYEFKRSGTIITTQVPVSHGENYTICGLRNGSCYELSVRAHNSAGFGDPYIIKYIP